MPPARFSACHATLPAVLVGRFDSLRCCCWLLPPPAALLAASQALNAPPPLLACRYRSTRFVGWWLLVPLLPPPCCGRFVLRYILIPCPSRPAAPSAQPSLTCPCLLVLAALCLVPCRLARLTLPPYLYGGLPARLITALICWRGGWTRVERPAL